MAKTREKREQQLVELAEWNYLPLLIQFMGPIKTGRLFAFLLAWWASGEPEPKEYDDGRRVIGYSRAACYLWLKRVHDFAAWLPTKGFFFSEEYRLAHELAQKIQPRSTQVRQEPASAAIV
jgi:hypothetical protein